MALLRAGKRAGLVAEQLGIQQVFIQRRAVKRDERPLPAVGEVVQTVGDQLLAGAALADHQHRLVQLGDLGDLLQDFDKGVCLAQQILWLFVHDEIRQCLVK